MKQRSGGDPRDRLCGERASVADPVETQSLGVVPCPNAESGTGRAARGEIESAAVMIDNGGDAQSADRGEGEEEVQGSVNLGPVAQAGEGASVVEDGESDEERLRGNERCRAPQSEHHRGSEQREKEKVRRQTE